eukprot:m.110223 g.110223  ORF g.110223 m.110223 type:complete len:407 (-) comp15909_c0_seq1:67-1287(-)
MALDAKAGIRAKGKKVSPVPPVTMPIALPDRETRDTEQARNVKKLLDDPRLGLINIQGQDEKCDSSSFRNMKVLGQGSFGTVHHVQHMRTGCDMADKRLSLKSERVDNFLKEMNLITASQSPHIVKYYGFNYFESQLHIYMELMWVSFDTVLSNTKKRPSHNRIPEFVLQKMTSSVTHALHYLKAEKTYLHRDVKPSNILLGFGGEMKICDFGISEPLMDSVVHITGGSSFYMAPESFQNNKHDVRSDVWSLGVTLVELATGSYPFPKDSEFILLNAIANNDPPSLRTADGFTETFVHFVGLCLRKDPEERPKYILPANRPTEGSCALLMHPFIAGADVKDERVRDWYLETLAAIQEAPPAALSLSASSSGSGTVGLVLATASSISSSSELTTPPAQQQQSRQTKD